MKPYQHAKISAKKHGGIWENYISIHEFFDGTKQSVPSMAHRAILHNSHGIFLCENYFRLIHGGPVLINADGRAVSIRDIGEEHVLEDLGFIPTLEQCLRSLNLKGADNWLGGPVKKVKVISMSRNEEVEASELLIRD